MKFSGGVKKGNNNVMFIRAVQVLKVAYSTLHLWRRLGRTRKPLNLPYHPTKEKYWHDDGSDGKLPGVQGERKCRKG